MDNTLIYDLESDIREEESYQCKDSPYLHLVIYNDNPNTKRRKTRGGGKTKTFVLSKIKGKFGIYSYRENARSIL